MWRFVTRFLFITKLFLIQPSISLNISDKISTAIRWFIWCLNISLPLGEKQFSLWFMLQKLHKMFYHLTTTGVCTSIRFKRPKVAMTTCGRWHHYRLTPKPASFPCSTNYVDLDKWRLVELPHLSSWCSPSIIPRRKEFDNRRRDSPDREISATVLGTPIILQ